MKIMNLYHKLGRGMLALHSSMLGVMQVSRIEVSFEFFPPADDVSAGQLLSTVQRLSLLEPRFVSITCGAGGSSRPRTRQWVLRLLRSTSLQVVPHLTCIDSSREELSASAREYWDVGIRQLVALRGDRPDGAAVAASDAGFSCAAELVGGLRQVAAFDLFVSAYPEGHPENPGVDADVRNLKRKVEAGARRAITQFFFDTDAYLAYRDRCAAAGIDVPIVPGILPITRFSQVQKFAARCGATIPRWLQQRFEGLEQDLDTQRLIAAHLAIEQVQRLQRHGVNEFHFYTLNRADLTYAICHALGVRPARAEAEVRVA